jgi:rhodanese-related sulfurtransferase
MKYTVIDVREPQEYSEGHIKGSLNIPPSSLLNGAKELDDLPKDEPIIVYCVSGSRSNASMHILQSLGYTNVTNGINKQQVAAKYGLELA